MKIISSGFGHLYDEFDKIYKHETLRSVHCDECYKEAGGFERGMDMLWGMETAAADEGSQGDTEFTM
ncbi:hypothetical protein PG984_014073 [Apiospora sp. TS-2023a]